MTTDITIEQGARAEHNESGLRLLLRRVIDEAGKDAPRRELRELFLEKLETDPENQRLANIYTFNNLINRILVPKTHRRELTTREKEDLEAQKKVRLGMLGLKLMEMRMPNGKRLGDCTGLELEEMRPLIGRFLGRITGQMAPGATVKETFDEKTLRALWAN